MTSHTADVLNFLEDLSETELDRIQDLVTEDRTSGASPPSARSAAERTERHSRHETDPLELEGVEQVAAEQVVVGVTSTDIEPPVDAATAPAPRQNRFVRIITTVVGPLVVFVFFMGGWYFFTYAMLTERRRFMMPPPHQVMQKGFLEWRNLHEILMGLWSTTQVAVWGLAIAITLGMIFATLMSQARWVENSFYPYAVVLQTIPIIALVPLIGLWFDFSFRARVIVCVLIALFPIITNTLFGLKSADTGHHDLFTLHGASRNRRLRKLMFPAAQPAIFAGFRISAGLSVIGAIVGDFFFRKGEPGIGRLIDIYRQNLQTEMLYTSIFWSSMLGITMFWSFGLLGTMLLRKWHESAITKES